MYCHVALIAIPADHQPTRRGQLGPMTEGLADARTYRDNASSTTITRSYAPLSAASTRV